MVLNCYSMMELDNAGQKSMNSCLTRTIDHDVVGLAATLNTVGHVCIPNFIEPAALRHMQRFVLDTVGKAGHEYVGLNGPDAVTGSGLDELYRDPAFQTLIRDIYEQGTGRAAPDEPFLHVLRCLAGASGQKHAWMFHYDSYVVTALVPILIPAEGRSGDLLMFPNTRPIRPWYLWNAADKVLLDNPLTQKLLRRAVERNPGKPVRLRMQPGNLYLFWGYRSIHTNEPCDPDKVRATALFHYANPHGKQAGIRPS